MKTLVFTLITAFLGISLSSNASISAKKDLTDVNRRVRISVSFTGEIGIPEKQCKGIGTGCLGIDIHILIGGADLPEGSGRVVFEVTDDRFITLSFQNKEGNNDMNFVVNSSFKLSSDVSKALGFKSVALTPGSYTAFKNNAGGLSVKIPYQAN
jgi:hypothetical protein